jgi:hypothetical protein
MIPVCMRPSLRLVVTLYPSQSLTMKQTRAQFTIVPGESSVGRGVSAVGLE